MEKYNIKLSRYKSIFITLILCSPGAFGITYGMSENDTVEIGKFLQYLLILHLLFVSIIYIKYRKVKSIGDVFIKLNISADNGSFLSLKIFLRGLVRIIAILLLMESQSIYILLLLIVAHLPHTLGDNDNIIELSIDWIFGLKYEVE